MNEFTKNVFMDKHGCIVSEESKSGTGAIMLSGVALSMTNSADAETKANTELTFTAFTTATKLAEMGYDAQKVLEVLPEIMREIDNSFGYGSLGKILGQCRGE